ncbi:hypothetical protein SPPR111872_00425 [Sphingobacterium prati]
MEVTQYAKPSNNKFVDQYYPIDNLIIEIAENNC